jgi:hypothetical protein
MKINIIDSRKKLAIISFYLLFPGFFFYHYLVGSGFLFPYLGGYFGIVSTITLIITTILNLIDFRLTKKTTDIIFYIIILHTSITATLNYLLESPTSFSTEMFFWSLAGITQNISCYLIAKHLNFNKNSLNILSITLILMFLTVIFNIGNDGIFYIQQEASADISDLVSNYQGFARSLIFVLLLLAAYNFKSNAKFIIINTIGIVALFFNGARADFILFIASTLSLYLFKNLINLKKIALSLAAALLFIISGINFIQLDYDSRMLEIFDLSNSTSHLARELLFENGLDIISNNLIFGSYGAYTDIDGIGSYPHNLTSAWVNLGILGFILYIVIIANLWIYTIWAFLKKRTSSAEFNVFFLFLVYVSLALYSSKDYSYMLVGFLIGLRSRLDILQDYPLFTQR